MGERKREQEEMKRAKKYYQRRGESEARDYGGKKLLIFLAKF